MINAETENTDHSFLSPFLKGGMAFQGGAYELSNTIIFSYIFRISYQDSTCKHRIIQL